MSIADTISRFARALGLMCLFACCNPQDASILSPGELGVRGPDSGHGAVPLAGPAPFSFVVIGDTQPYFNKCVAELSAFPGAVLDLAPRFALHMGDLMDIGRDPRAYHKFERCYRDLLAKVPLFPTVGNHDLDWGHGGKNYKAYLERQLFSTNPVVYGAAGHGTYKADFKISYNDDPRTYSTDYDNPADKHIVPSGVSFKTFYAFRHEAAYFISFEQGAELELNTPLPWLEKHLKAARADPQVRFIIVFMHHPMYATFLHEGYLTPLRTAYEALLRKYDVTLVLAGHAHAYDRFHVPDNKFQTYTKAPPGRYRLGGQAVHHIVSGPAGASFLPGGCDPVPKPYPHPSLYYSQARGCGHHMLQIVVRQHHLEVKVIGVSGDKYNYKTALWDAFIIAPGEGS